MMMRFSLPFVLLVSRAQADPCDCIEGPWTYSADSIVYQAGCTATSDWNQTWCYVMDKEACMHDQPSTIDDTRAYKTCSPCNCRGAWDFMDEGTTTMVQYDGCRDDVSGEPWCQVQGSKENCDVASESDTVGEGDWKACDQCKCMNEWNYIIDNNHTMQMGCYTDTNWDHKQWCYVEGDSHCDEAMVSDNAEEHRSYKMCEADPCDCIEGPWTYGVDGITYEGGCTATSDWKEQPWCYVKDKKACMHAKDSTVEGEERGFKTCSPCNCRGAWDFKDASAHALETYVGCRNDTLWKPWCQVQGSRANCDVSVVSGNAGEGDWKVCEQCKCMNKWNYNNTMQIGCFKDPNWGNKEWCYVEGDSHCDSAMPSLIMSESRSYMMCGAEAVAPTCGAAKSAYKDSNCCGNPTSPFMM